MSNYDCPNQDCPDQLGNFLRKKATEQRREDAIAAVVDLAFRKESHGCNPIKRGPAPA
jgi:hypothetical protein